MNFLKSLIHNEYKQYKNKNHKNFLDVFLDIAKK